MALILDAYNVIGALDRYAGPGPLEHRRELLINDALKAAGWTGQQIIPVFDAPRDPEPRRTHSLAGGAVRVIYTGSGESADDAIERLLAKLPLPVTVYTADFALQRTALARGATRAIPREFADLLDELPALSRNPTTPRRSKLYDHLSPEARQKFEEIRRRES